MEKTETVKRYKIPQDLIMDILRILFLNKIKHQITGVKERENFILMSVFYNNESHKGLQAQENIESILKDYTEYMKGLLGDNTLCLDEEEDQ